MTIRNFVLFVFLFITALAHAEEIQVAELNLNERFVNETSTLIHETIDLIKSPFTQLSKKDADCMARNIFYEAGGEPIEGKVAVAMVTINRTQSGDSTKSVCEVVKQKTLVPVAKTKTISHVEKTGWGWFEKEKIVEETKTTWSQRAICQFSWNCNRTVKIKETDPRWIETRQVVEELMKGGYAEYQVKYMNARHFHEVHVHPRWNLPKIGRTGNHIFYE